MTPIYDDPDGRRLLVDRTPGESAIVEMARERSSTRAHQLSAAAGHLAVVDSRRLDHPRLGLIEIRRLTPVDLDRFAAFLASLSEQSRHWFHPHGFDRAAAERIIAGAAGDDTQARWLLLIRDEGQEVVAGYGFLWNLHQPAPSLGIAVRDAFQDQGLGGCLMQFLLDAARSRGCASVQLTVYDDNPRARHLYARFGFITRRLVHHMQVDLRAPEAPLGRPPAGAGP